MPQWFSFQFNLMTVYVFKNLLELLAEGKVISWKMK